MKSIIILATSLAVVAFASATPALADHDHDDDRHDNYNNGYGHHHHRYYNNWDQQRSYYSNNWQRISRSQQRALDRQMRAHWYAYHNNNWNGNTSWSTYNDPGFFDYLHTRNPSLMTRIESYIRR
ncbi:MAG: hypothetical protein JSS83_11055 [Cyanobacteria bacterium SZAS LIN-3]|nr:hypothetical protein [Cyanobacteria bacterium SZAS LIN-3]MBS2005998.1 hypothetical protein [Cyanobacteria bacterium SZAS TMP-1]